MPTDKEPRRGIVVGSGGRTPGQPDQLGNAASNADAATAPVPEIVFPLTPPTPTEARLTIIQITDVYTLKNFCHLKTLIEQVKEQSNGGTVISMLTGDFLSPYLLSSIDRGAGMMNALAKTPIDYVTWGNHEADIHHGTVCRHVKNFPGIWLNTNMQSHEAMEYQQPFDVIEITSPDGTNARKVGLVAVLSDDPGLYSHFKPPGAFGGASIADPWETLRTYKALLEKDHGCDVVLPLQHMYVPDDHKTCKEFDFPVILSGHDHHRVDSTVDGTRLLKPGLDANFATVLEFSWRSSGKQPPNVNASFVECKQWKPDLVLLEETARAYDVLLPMRNTELARVPPAFEPLSSANSRGRVCTMGKLICTLLRSSLNTLRRQRLHKVDAVLLMGGNIRGGTDYPLGSFFSLEALEAEIKSDEDIGVVSMPGWLISDGIGATHAGAPIPGWMQYDEGIQEDFAASPPVVTHIGGVPLDPGRTYRVATKISDLTNGQSPPFTEYFSGHSERMPPKGAYVNVPAELMGSFARNLWRKIWVATIPRELGVRKSLGDIFEFDNWNPKGHMERLDQNGDGTVSVDDIQVALRDLLGLSVHDEEKTLATYVHTFADTTGDGKVTLHDFETYRTEMPALYQNERWRLDHPESTRSSLCASSTIVSHRSLPPAEMVEPSTPS